jgi:leucyl-tRNA synthetase
MTHYSLSAVALRCNPWKEAREVAALADANVSRHVDPAAIKKVIVVPGKLVNIVVRRAP